MSYRYVVLRMVLEKYCFDKIAIMGKKGGKGKNKQVFPRNLLFYHNLLAELD